MRKFSANCLVSVISVGSLLSAMPAQDRALISAEEEPAVEAEIKQQRNARSRAMYEEARTVAVKSQSDVALVDAEFHGEPVFRYADVPRGILDASLWCWGRKGRPVALAKLEMVAAHDDIGPKWQYCVASLCERRVAVEWLSYRRFLAKKAGVILHTIPDASPPDEKPVVRLRQMKEIFKRFSATILVDGKASLKQEMRQLASPVYRYADTDASLMDGAIFAFSTNGTNPDVLLLVEAESATEMPPQWKYAVVGMTYAEFHVRLDQSEVFMTPFPPPFDTWAIHILPRPPD
jgi:hypothetical protein